MRARIQSKKVVDNQNFVVMRQCIEKELVRNVSSSSTYDLGIVGGGIVLLRYEGGGNG